MTWISGISLSGTERRSANSSRSRDTAITAETGGGQSLLARLDQARSVAERAVTYSRGIAAHALHLLGEIATHPDRFDAERGALALGELRGMRPLVAHCRFGLGKLYRRRGELAQARECLTMATAMYREMHMQFWLSRRRRE
jgi:hypothetical protein